MRDYAQVRPALWTGATGRKLRGNANAQRVQFYLLTCASSNICGLYYLPLPTLCHDIGISLEGAREGLQSLSEAEFAHYDEETSYVWVVNAARENIGENPNHADNRVIGVRREVDKHKKSPFYSDFRAHYDALYQSAVQDAERPKHKAPRKPLLSPSVGSGGSGSGSGAGERAGEGEGSGTRVRARSVLRPVGSGQSESETADAEVLTPGHLLELFRATWHDELERDDPPLPAEAAVAEFAERVTNTAGLRSLPPAELFTATLRHWGRGELNGIEKRAPVQCFAQAFGEVVDQVIATAPPTTTDLLLKQANDALRGGNVEQYEALQQQLRELNGRASHARAAR